MFWITTIPIFCMCFWANTCMIKLIAFLFSFWEIAIPVMIVVIAVFLWRDVVSMVHFFKKKILVKNVEKVCVTPPAIFDSHLISSWCRNTSAPEVLTNPDIPLLLTGHLRDTNRFVFALVICYIYLTKSIFELWSTYIPPFHVILCFDRLIYYHTHCAAHCAAHCTATLLRTPYHTNCFCTYCFIKH